MFLGCLSDGGTLEKKFCNVILKETPTQLFSCEYCEVFKNAYFEEYLRTAASGQANI